MSQKALPHLTLVNEKGEPEEAEENESPLDESLLGKEPHEFDPSSLFAARTLGAPSDPLPLTSVVYSARCGATNSISNLLLAFLMEGLVKLQMVVVTFGSSALSNFKVW